METSQNKKIKIAFVINDFMRGGAQRQLTRQFPLFDRTRFEISLITLFEYPKEETLYHSIPSDVKVHRLNFKNFLDVRSIIQLIKVFRGGGFDIVVSSLFFSNTFCRLLKPLFHYISIAREHNTYTGKSNMVILIDWILSKISKKIVAVSSEVAKFTSKQENISMEKFVVIQNGIDLQEIERAKEKYSKTAKHEVAKRLGINIDKKIILNVGRMVPQKNHRALVSAFLEFSKKNPEFVLCILGGGSVLAEIEELVRSNNAEENISLPGLVTDVENFYLASEYLISTSLIEGLSNAHLEALAFGLPIVVTDTGGMRELLREGKNGILIKGFEKEDIVEALQSMTHANIVDMRSEALKTVQDFDIHKTVQRYQELFDGCLKK